MIKLIKHQRYPAMALSSDWQSSTVRLLLCLVFFSLLTSSCKKFVELDAPKTLVETDVVFEDDATATTALTGIYAQMMAPTVMMPFLISAYTALQSDELYSAYGLYVDLYQNSLRAPNAFTNTIWTEAYNYIYQANAVYEGCEKSESLSAPVKKQLMAEARFIRAFWYLYLVEFYGDVPLVLTTDYRINAVMARTSKDAVYEQLISDLEYAQSHLNIHYVAANSTATSNERIRPNKAAATALLARAYLYSGKYADAVTQASTVITDANYSIEADLSKTFLKDSKEAIWQLMKPTPTQGIDTYEGKQYIFTTVPTTSSSQSFTITDWLYTAFEADDTRKSNWIGKGSGGDYYFPYKYKMQNNSGTTAIEHSIVIRLAEVYLIRAEAHAQLGELAEAILDLDTIRNRAGLPLILDTNPAISKEDMLAAIYKERRVELFTEWGHRWIDLKRTGQVDAAMTAIAASKNTIWDPTKQLWPIPEKDVNNNRNLKQNPGYN